MDDSQSSDFQSQSTDVFSPEADSIIMDTGTYESFLQNTKTSFSSIRKEIKKSTFYRYFSNLLNDCSMCIAQSLDLINKLLSEDFVNVNKVAEYMNDAVCLLQLLSDLVNNVMESISMSCSSMNSFPVVTGQIIMSVFIHCKDSETVYGSQLSNVEKQIKDLFRTCHELQLTYLSVMEKHYTFDLSKKEEQDILVEALDINLTIGEIVQSLDVKTMAEQWKAYIVICEKYSNTLMHKRIYKDCTNLLCTMATNNIKTALEPNQDSKVSLRSLKVSSFILKILLKVCITFKHAVMKDYDNLMELLLFVYLNNEAYLHTMCEKTPQFINLFNKNVIIPVNTLLEELLYDNHFLQCICNYGIDKIKKEDKLLGLILLIISAIKSLLQKGGDQLAQLQKHKFINVIYSFLPYCHIWFHMGLQFKCEVISNGYYQQYGLYEHLLTHTVTLAAMMITEENNILEMRMLEAILGTDCLAAMFSSNLWTILARMTSRQLLFSQVISLNKIYQKLEQINSFSESPQKVHLSNTISRLFEVMPNEDKMKFFNMFNIRDEKNIGLWICIKINNLPSEVQYTAENFILEEFKICMRKLIANENADIYTVIKLIHLVSTCSHMSQDIEVGNLLLEGWYKACPSNIEYTVKHLQKETLWYYEYVQALVLLTASMEHIFHGNSENLVKVLHVVSNIVHSACRELKLVIINILCKLANFETNDVNKRLLDSILTQTFSKLFDKTDSTVRNKLLCTLRMYKSSNLLKIADNVVNKDESLREVWPHFIRYGTLENIADNRLKEQLLSTFDFKYCHKCMEEIIDLRDSGTLSSQKSLDFDLIDVNTLFEPEVDVDSVSKPEVDAEPACKKAKLDIDDAEDIISRIESDTKMLCKIKENVFTSDCRKRLRNVCNKLISLID